jgi:hypothetical protein
MEAERLKEVHGLLEVCQHLDSTDFELEKTEALAELLAEVERLGSAVAVQQGSRRE